jgi:hypothetical protein
MHCETKIRVAVKHLQKWPIAADVRIREHLGKIADRLMSMNAEEQVDRRKHRLLPKSIEEKNLLGPPKSFWWRIQERICDKCATAAGA